jgi:hypothetical protein
LSSLVKMAFLTSSFSVTASMTKSTFFIAWGVATGGRRADDGATGDG